jgi:uncharacterized FlgJ-related protein
MLKVDDKTLEVKRVFNYKIPFCLMFVLNIFCLVYIAKQEYSTTNKTRIIYKTDTMIVERKDVALNDSAIAKELTRLGCVLPNIAIAQFRVETGNYKSDICKENKNLAGIRNSASPLSIGKNRGHNAYKSYRDCLKDYIRIQNKYLKNIDGKYAEAEGYVKLIKSMKK